jgi:hypothetical protein
MWAVALLTLTALPLPAAARLPSLDFILDDDRDWGDLGC